MLRTLRTLLINLAEGIALTFDTLNYFCVELMLIFVEFQESSQLLGNFTEIYMLYSKTCSFYFASRIQFGGVTWPKVEPDLCHFVLEEYFNVAL